MSGYASVDADIDAWIDRHQLVLFSSSGGEECRSAFLSSDGGDTFQIWVDLPTDENVTVGLAWINGPIERPTAPEPKWIVPTAEISFALERAMAEALALMAPQGAIFLHGRSSNDARAAAQPRPAAHRRRRDDRRRRLH
ncbi:hypothetical protein [Devosia insulae]|uniref:hypothetical protein n=1 Tax=Devosia insulae TaxID=408174 RepID=UPI00114CC1FD|nr:hypothetical protein [Devosia insulae]